jgi:hypothetical protein
VLAARGARRRPAIDCFKLAVVLEGIHTRHLRDPTACRGSGRERLAVPVLIDRAQRILGSGPC